MTEVNELSQTSFEHNSIVEVLEVIGDRWTLCVLSEAFNGVRRFADMRDHLGIASNILSNRLARLVRHEVLEQLPYKETGKRTRYEYQLTAKGLALLPALVALIQWGDHYMPTASIVSASLVRAECNQEVHLEIVCADGHRVESIGELKRIVRLAQS